MTVRVALSNISTSLRPLVINESTCLTTLKGFDESESATERTERCEKLRPPGVVAVWSSIGAWRPKRGSPFSMNVVTSPFG